MLLYLGRYDILSTVQNLLRRAHLRMSNRAYLFAKMGRLYLRLSSMDRGSRGRGALLFDIWHLALTASGVLEMKAGTPPTHHLTDTSARYDESVL